MSSARSLLVFALLLLAAPLAMGCSEPGRDAPLRSPSQDYGPPTPTTSDGRVVGVDNKSPGTYLAETVSTQGPAPGWSFQRDKPLYDSRRRVGGALDLKLVREERFPVRPAPSPSP